MYFAFTLYTVVGFGDFAPRTAGGKALVVGCTIFGMVVAFALVAEIGARLLDAASTIRAVRDWPAAVFASLFAAYVLAGGAYFHGLGLLQDSASVWDGAYYCFVAVSTLGLGDKVPRVTALPLLSTYVYTIFGIALASASIHAMAEVGGDPPRPPDRADSDRDASASAWTTRRRHTFRLWNSVRRSRPSALIVRRTASMPVAI